MRLLFCAALLALPGIAFAQATACTDSTVHFEYQMSRPARWLRDTASAVHPTAAVRDPANLIQFVVDTFGVPQPRTFRALKVADSALVAEARRIFTSWRYAPGLLNACRVRQLVQTPIGR
jgi:hypothetical protein